jgi:hypothetical protein
VADKVLSSGDGRWIVSARFGIAIEEDGPFLIREAVSGLASVEW